MSATATSPAASKLGVDAYRFWRAKLRNEEVEPLKTCHGDVWGDPQPGLWKMRDGSRTAPFVPVKIWLVDKATGKPTHRFVEGTAYECAAFKGKSETPLSHDETVRVWSFCMRHAITITDRDTWLRTGLFPGEVAASQASAPAQATTAAAQAAKMLSGADQAATLAQAPAQIGDNSRGTDADPFDAIKREFDDYAEQVRAFLAKVDQAGGIKDKAGSDTASNMADMIGKVKGGIAMRADDARKAYNAPFAAKIDANNERYNPMIGVGIDLAKALRARSLVWVEAEEDRLRKEAHAKAVAEAAAENAKREAERKRLADEAEAKAAAETAAMADMAAQLGDDPTEIVPVEPEPVELTPDLAPVPVIVPEVRVHTGGQRGAKRGLKKEQIATITNYAETLAYFAENEKVKELIGKLAQAAVKAGATVPGVTVTTQNKL